MPKTNVFISYDFEHDFTLRELLQAQGENLESPFQMTDCSVEELFTEEWVSKVRERIRRVDQVIFICGGYTNLARGMALEYALTREEGKPYFLLQGRENKAMSRPRLALSSDNVYAWTGDNLKSLIAGKR